jgi:hypothetical protein
MLDWVRQEQFMKHQAKRQGQGLVEYALLLGLIGLIGALSLNLLGSGIAESMEPLTSIVDVPSQSNGGDARASDADAPDQDRCNASATLRGEELITNGSFEEPALHHRSWRTLQDVPGWTGQYGIEIQNNVAGKAHTGAALTELGTYRSSSLHQVVETSPHCTYTLSFAFSARPNTRSTENVLRVYWNGEELTTLVKSGNRFTNWEIYTFEVTALSEESIIQFQDAGFSNGLGPYLDTVSLVMN